MKLCDQQESALLSHYIFRDVHKFTPGIVIAIDSNGIITYANPAALKDFCLLPQDFEGQPLNRFYKSLFGGELADKQLTEHRFDDLELIKINLEGDDEFVCVHSVVVADVTNEVNTYLFIRDITAQKKKEAFFAFLNTAAEELAQARDTESALQKISRLIVPNFANWFTVEILKQNQVELLVLEHEDPDKVKWAIEYRKSFPTDLNSDSGTARVIKTGIPTFIPAITPEMISASLTDPHQLKVIRELNLQSIITVAIFNKKTITGAISLISTNPEHHYTESDLRLAQNFANHMGLALENARLNEEAAKEIIQRKEIEERLKITQRQLQSALSSGLVGTWVRDLEKNILYADESLSKMFGIPYFPEGCSPDVFTNSIHPVYKETAQLKRTQSIEEGGVYETEYKVSTEGSSKWFFARGKTETSESGKAMFFTGVVIDITARKEAEIELQESEERFKRAIENTEAGVYDTDLISGKTIRSVRHAQIYGYKDNKEEWTTDLLRSHILPEDMDVSYETYQDSLKSGNLDNTFRIKRIDGAIRWINVLGKVNYNEKHEPVRIIGTVTDITEKKELQKQKDEFISTVSHELKTPVTSIKAYNQFLKRSLKGDENLKNRSFLERMEIQISRLQILIRDLLDVTRIENNKLILKQEPLNLNLLLTETISDLQLTTPTHKLLITENNFITINCDRDRIIQVITNLVTNAVKYSPENETIYISLKQEDKQIVFCVEDFGIGIPEEHHSYIFNRFHQVGNTNAQAGLNLGLGLYICKEIVHNSGGKIWLESKVGKGTRFYFSLPL